MEKELDKLLDDFWSQTFPLYKDEWKEYVSKVLIKFIEKERKTRSKYE